MKTFFIVLLLSCASFAQISNPGGSGTGITQSATVPATCTVGDVYFHTTVTGGAIGLYECRATNTWSGPPTVGGGITNAAGLNIFMMSDGTNAIGSGVTGDGTGNVTLPAGKSIGSSDTGTPKITFGTNLITLNQPLSVPSITTTGPAAASTITCVAAPSTPNPGQGAYYCDTTSKAFAIKNDAGVVSHTVQSKTAVANNFVTQIADDGAVSVAQPSAANLSNGVTGSGAVVLASAPTIANLTVTGSCTGCGGGSVSAGTNISVNGSAVSFNPMDSGTFYGITEFNGGPAAGRLGPDGTMAYSNNSAVCSPANGTFIAGQSNTGAMRYSCTGNAPAQNFQIHSSDIAGTFVGVFGDLSTYTNWEFRWTIYMTTNSANELFYFGVGDNSHGIFNGNGIGWRYDTTKGDATWKPFCVKSNSFTTPVASTGTYPTPTNGHFYTFRIYSTVTGTAKAEVFDNGVSVATQTAVCTTGGSTFPTGAPLGVNAYGDATTTGAAAFDVQIDRLSWYTTGITGR